MKNHGFIFKKEDAGSIEVTSMVNLPDNKTHLKLKGSMNLTQYDLGDLIRCFLKYYMEVFGKYPWDK